MRHRKSSTFLAASSAGGFFCGYSTAKLGDIFSYGTEVLNFSPLARATVAVSVPFRTTPITYTLVIAAGIFDIDSYESSYWASQFLASGRCSWTVLLLPPL